MESEELPEVLLEKPECLEDESKPVAAAEEPPHRFLEQQHLSLLQSIEEALAQHFHQLQDLHFKFPALPEKGFPALPEKGRPVATSITAIPTSNHARDGKALQEQMRSMSTSKPVRQLMSQHSQARCYYGDAETHSQDFFPRNSIHSFASLQVRKQATARETVHDDVAKFQSKLTPVVVPRFTQRLVQTDTFEWLSASLILSNAIFYGIEAQVDATTASHNEEAFQGVSDTFNCLFALEVLLRLGANVQGFFCGKQRLWNLFDTLIVSLSFAERASRDLPDLSFIRIVRLTRTVRLYRTVQYLRIFTGLRILVSSVVNTLRSLAWTMFLLASILYVFGLLFTQTALDYFKREQQDPEVARELYTYFGTLLRSTSTLFKCITNGISWHQVSEPLAAVHPVWEMTFCIFISFTCLAVLNVVTGVFCQSAIESAQRDKDGIVQHQITMTEKYTNELRAIFKEMDSEATGIVTLKTFEECLQDSQMKAYFNGMDMSCDDAWNLFKLLDSDESCGVDIEEFVHGCLKLQGSARSIDTHMLLYESRWSMRRLHEIASAVAQLGGLCEAHFMRPSDCMSDCHSECTIAI